MSAKWNSFTTERVTQSGRVQALRDSDFGEGETNQVFGGFFKINLFILFIFGCVGSSLLHTGFL